MRNIVALALASALVCSSCSFGADESEAASTVVTSTTISIRIFVDIEIDRCARSFNTRQALSDFAGVPDNAQLVAWIDDNRDVFEAWCMEHYLELFPQEERKSPAIQDAVAKRFDAADQFTRDSLTDAQLVWCFNRPGAQLVVDAALTLDIGPSALADDVRIEVASAQSSRVLSRNEVRERFEGDWDAWYALQPRYFLRSCQTAYEAFSGSAP